MLTSILVEGRANLSRSFLVPRMKVSHILVCAVLKKVCCSEDVWRGAVQAQTPGAIVEVENWSVMLRCRSGAEAKVRNFQLSLTYQQRSGGRISVFVGVESVKLSLVALS